MRIPRAALGLAILAALPAPAAAAGGREGAALAWMLETCAAFFETGRRAALGNLVAAKGGGVCNGDPACEGPDMIFTGEGRAGMGAVRVRIPGGADDRVDDAPDAGLCEPAPGTGMLTADFPQIRDWAQRAVAAGRLVADGTAFAGCAWNGRVYRLLPQGGPMAAFRFELKHDARACAAPTS